MNASLVPYSGVLDPSSSSQFVRYALLKHLEEMQGEMEAVQAAVTKAQAEGDVTLPPVAIVTDKEWSALLIHCVCIVQSDDIPPLLTCCIGARK